MLLHLIKSLLKAPTWREAQWIVEQHPSKLLDPSVDSYIQSLIEDQESERTQRLLEEIRLLLADCREIGIEQAFEMKINTVVRQDPQRTRRQLDLDSLNVTADEAVRLLTAMRLSVRRDTQDIIELWQENPKLSSIASNQEALTCLLRRYPDLAVILDLPSSEFEVVSEQEQIETPPEFMQEFFILQNLAGNPSHMIQEYERILERPELNNYPLFRALLLSNLGSNYFELPIGDRLYNVRQAIKYLQNSLKLWEPNVTPINYGQNLSNLGTAYSKLPSTSDEFGENLAHAIKYFHEALKFLDPNVAPRGYATTLINLGELYRNLPGELEENLRLAISCYERALQVYKPEVAPLKYALAQHNLGIAYGQLPTHRQENLYQAIKSFKEALRFRTPALPRDYASTLYNIGFAYSELPDQNPDNLAQSIDYLQAALKIYTPEDIPFQCRMTAKLLGDIYSRQAEWSSAYKAYDLAWSAGKELYRFAFIPISQQNEIETNSALCDRLLVSCLHLRDSPVFIRKALLYAEEGKARTFLEQMGQSDFPFPSDVPEMEHNKEGQLLNQLRKIEQKLIKPNLSLTEIEQYAQERHELKDRLNLLWNNLSSQYPTAQEYVNLRRARPPIWDEVIELTRNLGSEISLVEFYTLSNEIIAFIVRDGWDNPKVFTLQISRQAFIKRYFNSYKNDVWEHRFPSKYEWLKLGKELLEPLLEDIKTTKLIYFIPHGLLHVMPLHALTVKDNPFISHHAVAYSPSLAVLARTLRDLSEAHTRTSALVMGYEPSQNTDFLDEAVEVAQQFGCHPYLNSAANIQTLLQLAPTAHHIHLSCHGSFNPENILDSCIHLFDGEFTSRRWMETRLQADLVTLSACQTGINQVNSGDEIVGTTRALLYAGASTVLLTLWSVRADTTREWMLDFYKRTWDQSIGKLKEEAYAFQEATLNLFKKYPKDPSIWAAFFLIGDWR